MVDFAAYPHSHHHTPPIPEIARRPSPLQVSPAMTCCCHDHSRYHLLTKTACHSPCALGYCLLLRCWTLVLQVPRFHWPCQRHLSLESVAALWCRSERRHCWHPDLDPAQRVQLMRQMRHCPDAESRRNHCGCALEQHLHTRHMLDLMRINRLRFALEDDNMFFSFDLAQSKAEHVA